MTSKDDIIWDRVDALLEAYKANHDVRIRNKIVDVMAPFVNAIVCYKCKWGSDIEDIQQFCLVYGLIPAIDLFTCERGVPFRAYAGGRIGYSILNYYRLYPTNGVKIPQDIAAKVSNVIAGGKTEELSDILRCKVACAMGFSSVASLSQSAVGTDELHVADIAIPDPSIEILNQMCTSSTLERIIRKLTPKQREFVELYFFNDWSITEIAHFKGVTVQSVAQLRDATILRLKRFAVIMQSALDGTD